MNFDHSAYVTHFIEGRTTTQHIASVRDCSSFFPSLMTGQRRSDPLLFLLPSLRHDQLFRGFPQPPNKPERIRTARSLAHAPPMSAILLARRSASCFHLRNARCIRCFSRVANPRAARDSTALVRRRRLTLSTHSRSALQTLLYISNGHCSSSNGGETDGKLDFHFADTPSCHHENATMNLAGVQQGRVPQSVFANSYLYRFRPYLSSAWSEHHTTSSLSIYPQASALTDIPEECPAVCVTQTNTLSNSRDAPDPSRKTTHLCRHSRRLLLARIRSTSSSETESFTPSVQSENASRRNPSRIRRNNMRAQVLFLW